MSVAEFVVSHPSKIQDILSQIDDSTDEYMRTSKDLTPMEKTKKVGDISKQFTRCKEYGDDKVSLAMQVGCSGGMNAPNYAMGFPDTHSRGINLQSLFPNVRIYFQTYDLVDKHIRKVSIGLVQCEEFECI